MLAALREHSVTAMLFPAGSRVDSPEGLRLVAQWAAGGHAIGNHSYAHRNVGSALAKEAGRSSLRYPAEDARYGQAILDANGF